MQQAETLPVEEHATERLSTACPAWRPACLTGGEAGARWEAAPERDAAGLQLVGSHAHLVLVAEAEDALEGPGAQRAQRLALRLVQRRHGVHHWGQRGRREGAQRWGGGRSTHPSRSLPANRLHWERHTGM